MTKLVNRHEFRVGVLAQPTAHESLAAGAGCRAARETSSSPATLPPSKAGADAELLQSVRDVPVGPRVSGPESVQYEEMTTREWQHGIYARDRWQVNNKLTLDLGLRYEYYPLMHASQSGHRAGRPRHADGAGLGGLGGNPEDLGIKVSKTLFAPRLGGVYRINEETVFPHRLRDHVQPAPVLATAAGLLPADDLRRLQHDQPVRFRSRRSAGHSMTSSGPDLSSGNIPLPNSYDMRTPADDVSRSRIQSWNVAVERRLAYDIAVDVGVCWHAPDRRLRRSRRQRVHDARAAAPPASRSTRSSADPSRSNLWGPRTRTNYHSLQVAINRPFKNGLLLKGAYTLSRAKNETDDDGWAGLNWNAPSQLSRNYALAGYDRPHVFQMAFVYELPYKTTSSGGNRWRRRFSATGRSTALQRLFGHAVHHHRQRRRPEHAGQHADREPERRVQGARRARRRRHLLRHVRVQPASGRDVRQHRPEPVPRARVPGTWTSRCSARSHSWAAGSGSSSGRSSSIC